MGNIKDYGTSLVATAPSPASSGTSLVVTTGHGSRFPDAPFDVTVHPANEIPTLDNAEKLTVTNKSGDTLTITRAAGDTTAKNIATGWRITNALFKQDLDAKADAAKVSFTEVSVSTAAGTAAKVGTTSGGSYAPATGDVLLVTFSASNTANNATLNIDGSGAKNIQTGGVNTSNLSLAGTKVIMWYDGTAYQLFGSQRTSDANTQYSEITTTEITAGSSSAARVISGRRAQDIVNKAQTGMATSGDLTYHTADTGNPHSVTKAQVGLADVDNTSNSTERAAAATLTNKRINPRVSSTASATSVTPTIATYDQYVYTALAANLTVGAPTGTPVNGNKLLFAIKDNGTSRTLTWNAAFAPAGIDMPTSTTSGKWHYVGFIYNSTAAKWHCIAATEEG